MRGRAEEICDFSKNNTGDSVCVESRVVAVSPKHNSVITSVFDAYPGTGLWIFEDGKYVHVDFEEPMQGWLYNVGIEFVYDEDGKEYCLLGEYSHARKPTRRIFKATYPYCNKENWRVVEELKSGETDNDRILHIHHIQKDPWSKFCYCCCGDTQAESRWFYSDDLGETWHLLIKDLPQGYLRCTNVIFTEKDVGWASDDRSHYLMHAERDPEGLVDVSTIEVKCVLPANQATNALAYIDATNTLFFYDRRYDGDALVVALYDIGPNELVELRRCAKSGEYTGSWGNRGKCYVHYPNAAEPLLAMGLMEEYKPCEFSMIGNDGHTYGTIFYEVTANKSLLYKGEKGKRKRISARLKNCIRRMRR